ncbi:RluA family pseudouridine synthase [Helicobacter apodemus]|uniref:RNA pseudouridylate synthase n=1 Tax=Helicobacter apodemus TaxID=135569 RepID=A0A2U8FE49_9HELI|nr:RluA family pseudouridine synthase [Helicobacter apodemus]AWI34489.1 RNA pseudouridine synthase [Helicobacter apodemus]
MPFIRQRFSIQTPIKAYQFLIHNLGLSMAKAQSHINKGKVIYKGKPLNNNEKNKILEDYVEIILFKPLSQGLKPFFENEDFALFNKPAQMLIHPKGNFHHYSLIDEIKFHCGKEATLIHRIDKETSGLVLVGKHQNAIKALGELFAKRKIVKEYLALTKGQIPYEAFCINCPISTQKRGEDLSIRSLYLGQIPHKENLSFKTAKTTFETLGHYGDSTLLKAIPITGRTHQIRIHLLSAGYPVLGDPLYGCEDKYAREYLTREFISEIESIPLSPKKRLQYFHSTRLMLHAYSLSFTYKSQSYHFKSLQNFEIKSEYS